MRSEAIFWELIAVLSESGMLPNVMIVGSWAEYLYRFCFGSSYIPNLKTHDIDLYYGNPCLEFEAEDAIVGKLHNAGFLAYNEGGHLRSFFKEGIEVEFLSSQLGEGPGLIELAGTGIYAEKLSSMEMLRPLLLEARGYTMKVPTPASYVCHKLYINPRRYPVSKRLKDIEAVRSLLLYMGDSPEQKGMLRVCLESLPSEQRRQIIGVMRANGIQLP